MMSWTTVYIVGKSDFRQDVKRKLEHSRIPHMPGFIESSPEDPCDLYWLDGSINLKRFKETIGGKLIWKHRLRFYTNLEAFTASRQSQQETTFTNREREMINEMRAAS